MENNITKKYNWSISYEKSLCINANKLWEIISAPSNLELFHPFCLKNPTSNWPGPKSIDKIYYYNGLILERKFINWIENVGYDLNIRKKNNPNSFVSWRIKNIDKYNCKIKITISPYKFNMGNMLKEFIPFFLFIYPKIKKYLIQLLLGLEWYINYNKKIPKNKFGNNNFFSTNN